MVCRSKERGEKAVEEIKAKTGNPNVSLEVIFSQDMLSLCFSSHQRLSLLVVLLFVCLFRRWISRHWAVVWRTPSKHFSTIMQRTFVCRFVICHHYSKWRTLPRSTRRLSSPFTYWYSTFLQFKLSNYVGYMHVRSGMWSGNLCVSRIQRDLWAWVLLCRWITQGWW